MLNHRRLSYAILTGVAVCILCVSVLLAFSGNGHTQSNQQTQTATILRRGAPSTDQPPTAKELDDAATPIVDLYNSGPVDSDRQRKNSRYDGHHFVEHEVGPRTGEVVTEGRGNVADVPVNNSDLVIEGHVTESRAFLSNDKGNVYSEFTVRVTDVLKRAPDLRVIPGDLIVMERAGGRVRYPDGRVIRYGVVGQGSPMKGNKYLLFLSKAGQGNYKILTGYELRGNKVFALDGVRINNGLGRWPFDKHNGEDYERMRKAAEDAVKQDKGRGRP
jgi:hypothetical protein